MGGLTRFCIDCPPAKPQSQISLTRARWGCSDHPSCTHTLPTSWLHLENRLPNYVLMWACSTATVQCAFQSPSASHNAGGPGTSLTRLFSSRCLRKGTSTDRPISFCCLLTMSPYPINSRHCVREVSRLRRCTRIHFVLSGNLTTCWFFFSGHRCLFIQPPRLERRQASCWVDFQNNNIN